MIRDRYRPRVLTLGPAHSLTFPRHAYVTENLLYSAAERMRNRIHPLLYQALNAHARKQFPVLWVDLGDVGSRATQHAVERMREYRPGTCRTNGLKRP
jgi:hypothetical protein